MFEKDSYDFTLEASSNNTVLFKIDISKLKEYRNDVKLSVQQIINDKKEYEENIKENLVKVIRKNKITYNVLSVTVKDNIFDKIVKGNNKIKKAEVLVSKIQEENKHIVKTKRNFSCRIIPPKANESLSIPKSISYHKIDSNFLGKISKCNIASQDDSAINKNSVEGRNSLAHKISAILDIEEFKLTKELSKYEIRFSNPKENEHSIIKENEETIHNVENAYNVNNFDNVDKKSKRSNSYCKNSKDMNDSDNLPIDKNEFGIYVTETKNNKKNSKELDKSDSVNNKYCEYRAENNFHNSRPKIMHRKTESNFRNKSSCVDSKKTAIYNQNCNKTRNSCNEINMLINNSNVKDIVYPMRKSLNNWKRAVLSKGNCYSSGEYFLPLLSQIEASDKIKITKVKLKVNNDQRYVVVAK